MDPEGAVFCTWQAIEHKGAQIVNEPGSLNFNSLNTRDPEAAESFYGLLFGWETLGLGGGVKMWRLPGYGDFLAKSDPGIRERMAERAAQLGGRVVVPPFDAPWVRMTVITDPQGATFTASKCVPEK